MLENEILRAQLRSGYFLSAMKTFLTLTFVCAFAAACCADIQDPPSNDHGPTRKLGRGIANVTWGWSEIYPTVATVNTKEGNSAAAGYGVVRGVGRGFARFGVGLYQTFLFPFPLSHGTYMPVLPSDIRYIHTGYSEFPTELDNGSNIIAFGFINLLFRCPSESSFQNEDVEKAD